MADSKGITGSIGGHSDEAVDEEFTAALRACGLDVGPVLTGAPAEAHRDIPWLPGRVRVLGTMPAYSQRWHGASRCRAMLVRGDIERLDEHGAVYTGWQCLILRDLQPDEWDRLLDAMVRVTRSRRDHPWHGKCDAACAFCGKKYRLCVALHRHVDRCAADHGLYVTAMCPWTGVWLKAY